MVYLDNSATTKQDPRVTETMLQYMEQDFGNPSSMYRLGLTAEKAMKEARKTLLRAMGRESGQLYFTSGGTEANNMAVFGAGAAGKRRGRRILTSAVEHPSVLEACKKLEQQGFEVLYLGVDANCAIDMDQLREAVNGETILITMMQVNNEVGAILPVDEIAACKKEALFHTDAVQALGKTSLSQAADLISVSGHKIHGPKGTGALYIREGVTIPPLLAGGGQERNMRSGTENVPAIAGFGKAAELIEPYTQPVRQYLLDGIRETVRDIKINSPQDGVPSILNVSFLGTRGEVLLHTLEQDQVYVSTGSACSSNKKGQSHVLKAMGLRDKEIEGALRFSFSPQNTIEEMDYALDRLQKAVARFRKLGSFR